MGKIKPSRIISPRIVQPGEGGVRPWLWIAFLIALGAWSWQVFQFGQQRAGFDVGRRDAAEDRLRERVAELQEENDVLRAAAARFERAGQIDRAAVDKVKAEVKALQDERAELKRKVAFLNTLVSGGDKKALILDDYRLVEVGEREYRFEITVSKPADEDQDTVSGQVSIRVKGTLAGVDKTLEMDALTDGKRSNFGIRFKSFQKLKTELQLPGDFTPATVEVAVRPDGKAFKSFDQAYSWAVSDAASG
ncbi:MAG: hypothetical protein KDJ33_03335 [Gammaproteobacteria bacterium]|nr:hypothetical protein [Gammaproteobacteria bacterium]